MLVDCAGELVRLAEGSLAVADALTSWKAIGTWWVAQVAGLFEHAAVEFEPAQLAAQIQRRVVQGGRRGGAGAGEFREAVGAAAYSCLTGLLLREGFL